MISAEPRKNPNVRWATDADLVGIRTWLEAEEQAKPDSTFLCNWASTERWHKDGRLLVHVDPATQATWGYQWGGLVESGILEVRREKRGRGIGKALVEHCLALAVEANEPILEVHCQPPTSLVFWERMGFVQRIYEYDAETAHYDRDVVAYRVMPLSLKAPAGGEPVQVTFEWFPEKRKWDNGTPAQLTRVVQAVRLGDEVHLPERVLCYADLIGRDLVVRVLVGGQEWYCDKARYAEAAALGVQRCFNGFFVDKLRQPGLL